MLKAPAIVLTLSECKLIQLIPLPNIPDYEQFLFKNDNSIIYSLTILQFNYFSLSIFNL